MDCDCWLLVLDGEETDSDGIKADGRSLSDSRLVLGDSSVGGKGGRLDDTKTLSDSVGVISA